MKKLAYTAAAVAIVLTATAAAANGSPPDTRRHAGYAYTSVRQGVPVSAARFTVTSPQVRDGGTFPAGSWANGFGCSGGDQQPSLSWHDAPTGTRSYAITMFDRDAPTGSGFWHWLTWDIPATDTAVGTTPATGAVAGTNDAGLTGYLGPCPPVGDIAHHYRITVYALDVPSLQLPAATPAAITAFTMSSHVIGYARLTATAKR